MTKTEIRPADINTDIGPPVVHVFCDCSPHVTLCGLDEEMPFVETEEDPGCVVCDDLEPQPCGRCGE